MVHALPGEGDAGEVLGRWRIDSAIQHAVITGPGQVEAYTVEVSGPPYDRCGHRRRMTAGAPGVEVLATAWGMPPPLGAVGVQPQPTPGGPAVLAEGPMGRVELVDPYGPHAHVRVQRNGGGAFRLQGPGKETRGAALMMGPGGGVLAWDGDLLWWCADGAGTCASVPAADVVSAAGDTRVGGALVLLHRGVGWAVTG